MESAKEAYAVFVKTATMLSKELDLTEWHIEYKHEAFDTKKASTFHIDIMQRTATLTLNTSVTDKDTAKREATEAVCLILMANIMYIKIFK